jgi:hypothetical protein
VFSVGVVLQIGLLKVYMNRLALSVKRVDKNVSLILLALKFVEKLCVLYYLQHLDHFFAT